MMSTNTFHTERFIEELQTRGSFPSKIECSDGNIYIVKHSQLGNNYKQLINEYIAAHLAKAIGLSIPDFALIKINPEIFPDNVKFERGKPNGLGFGSKFLDGVFNVFLKGTKYSELKRISQKPIGKDFLAICIFDVWLRNSDRSINNCNLLIQETPKSIKLVAIDHVSIFAELNYLKLDQERNEHPPIGDTLIYHDFFSEMYYDNGIFFNKIKDELLQSIYDLPEDAISKIVESVPEEWHLSSEQKEKIKDFIIHRKKIIESQINSVLKNAGF